MARAIGPTSADEKRWQAESDAKTLSDSIAIRKDKKRLAEAVKASKRLVKEQGASMKENIKRQEEQLAGLKMVSTRKAKAFN